MRYTPKHTAAKDNTMSRKVAGATLVGAATVGAGLAQASTSSAASGSVWDRVAACESGGNWGISTGNGFYGGLQFTQQSWVGFGGRAYAPTASQASRSAQIAVAQKILATQGPHAWPECSIRAGLTRGNGGGAVATTAATTTVTRSSARAAIKAPVAHKPVAKPVVKVAAKPVGKVAAKPAAKPVGKVATKPATKPAAPVKAVAPKLVVDGVLGPKTTAALQTWLKVPATGVFNKATKVALQKELKVAQDGIVGPITTAALQSKIGLVHDGAHYLNARTVRALQTYLNNH